MPGRTLRVLQNPLRDFMRAFERSLPEPPWAALVAVLAGAAVAWWIYVPLHELLHAFGCLASGGSVERLEIGAHYGAKLLQKVFPFVAVGSDYAGQLTGFDTHGNDLTYLVTVFAPYLLTVVLGVPLLRRLSIRGSASVAQSFVLGTTLPVAYAPFYNIPGDFYELGSILVSRLAVMLSSGSDPARWRSDDVFKLAGSLFAEGPSAFDVAILSASFIAGVILAFATYELGRSLSRRVETSVAASGPGGRGPT